MALVAPPAPSIPSPLLFTPGRAFCVSSSTLEILAASAAYLFWPARTDDGRQVNVNIRPMVREDVLGIVGDRPGRELTDVLRESLVKHRERFQEAANGLFQAG